MPNYLEYEIAVLKSNIAACHLKLSDWNAAVEEATKSLEALDRLETPPASKSDDDDDDGVGVGGSDGAPFRTPGNNGNGLDKHLHHAAAGPLISSFADKGHRTDIDLICSTQHGPRRRRRRRISGR